MLGPRRTPVEASEVDPTRGSFVVRICAFEDLAARWELPLFAVRVLQFPAVTRLAGEAEVARLREASGSMKQKSCLSRPCQPDVLRNSGSADCHTENDRYCMCTFLAWRWSK